MGDVMWRGGIGRIVVPLDGGPAGAHALALACRAFAETTDEVQGIYVLRVPPQLPIGAAMPTARARAEDALARAADAADRCGVCLTTVLVTARAVGPGIVAAARGGDLIVLGQRPRHLVARLLRRQTLRYVLAHAPCPVLVAYVPAAAQARTRHNRFLLAPAGRPERRPGPASLHLVPHPAGTTPRPAGTDGDARGEARSG